MTLSEEDRESLDDVIERVLRALDGLEYGSVNITVHDAKVTQIDRTEKYRFTPAASRKASAPERSNRQHPGMTGG
ncbi:YezD family protein [Alicyclobacillus cycloheptanicus]|uniref:DUF2292 domain-containing protein n=1 Tax=Alicyclobacillus cycloheptanicus TaxID=1457 RepID=A0ABT9XH32_9BACL|nr:YezD family protein [Alicyclobacillus cycloheptanicus]MDQ0189585.1 hypothetical protein [Alicyclobacillus cycloheptanicus]WDL99896.1 YezD family protein [Alicyclobacillus cycloheptanicus]